MDKCTKCPECGQQEYSHEDFLGEGSRVCVDCDQEWWTDINYDKYRSPSYHYELFTPLGRIFPPRDKKGDVNHFDKRSVKRIIRKHLKDGWYINVMLTSEMARGFWFTRTMKTL